MTLTLLATVLGIAAVDAVNPSALAVTGLLVTRPDPWPRITAYIAGIFTLYLSIGLTVVFVFESAIDGIIEAISTPWITTGSVLLVGLVLVVAGLRPPHQPKRTRASLPSTMTTLRAFGLGMTITAVEASTALPYLGALALIVRAEPPTAAALGLLIAYNVVFVIPPIALALGVQSLGANRLTRITAKVAEWIGPGTVGRRITRCAIVLVGSALISGVVFDLFA